MPQFAVHLNPNPSMRATIPYLLDVQSDLIAELGSRVVVPLYAAEAMKGKVLKTLMPVFKVEGTDVVMVTQELAGVSRKALGEQVAELSALRNEIIAALDLLIIGI
ncbi:Toxin CcdB [compost metagenome]